MSVMQRHIIQSIIVELSMYQLSIISILFAAIVMLVLGMLLNYLLSNRNKVDYKSQYDEAETKLQSVEKKHKKSDGKLKQTSENRDMWQQKATKLESEITEVRSQADANLATLRVESGEQQSQIQSLSIELERSQRDKQQLQDNHNKLKEKYSANNKENKEWAAQLKKADKDRDEYKAKAIKAIKKSQELSEQLEAQTEKLAQFKEVSRELRRASAKAKKLTTDIAYWEQKHFDTHHELAAVIKNQEPMQEQLKNLNDLRSGDQLMAENMRKQLEALKNKYNEVNEKFKELAAKNRYSKQKSNS